MYMVQPDECSICLLELNDNDGCIMIDCCKKVVHIKCIEEWYFKNPSKKKSTEKPPGCFPNFILKHVRKNKAKSSKNPPKSSKNHLKMYLKNSGSQKSGIFSIYYCRIFNSSRFDAALKLLQA